MDINITGICITVLLGVLALGAAIFFGLRGFTDKIGRKVDQTKDDIVTELSDINEKIVKIDTNTDNLVQLANAYLTSSTGTVTRQLKNFGATKISALPASRETLYIIRTARGRLDSKSVSKISKETGFENEERKLLAGRDVVVQSVGSNILRVEVPSTDPELCTKYMSMFLKWLDTQYIETIKRETSQFEDNIAI